MSEARNINLLKATGIVRRIDELGRIVIPKEIRRTLRLREGDPVEIYTGENGEIILRKYSVMSDLNEFAVQFADSLAKTAGYPTCITDRDSVVAVSGISKKDFTGKRITRQLEQAMEDRSTFIAKDKKNDYFPILEGVGGDKIMSYVVTPIISHGDPVGSVIMFSPDNKNTLGDTEAKLTQSAAAVIGRQLEQ
ncbi:MAG TPA: AbrB/MazE/SpoVT family DNA-binding domain-containing protein [Candidatus Egerieisoma faecipullorum]|uniref:AbrB/MazE/SpoVT family DNA-binding domain-containing protein n=1 Tax=Candidatus Egerieisoma faecipullorum TaxID=2840963 RepID=A0A9D1I9F7_9CLOT|nr:AbrB/MazE/SpoVT family DNA-binding domain-containing protein [Candidatus Egerieisoma faecipullorum]